MLPFLLLTTSSDPQGMGLYLARLAEAELKSLSAAPGYSPSLASGFEQHGRHGRDSGSGSGGAAASPLTRMGGGRGGRVVRKMADLEAESADL